MAKAKQATAAPAAQQAAGGLPVFVAVNRIVYGKAQIAPAKSLFRPTTQKEADDLVALNAVREPTPAELALFTQVEGAAPATPATDETVAPEGAEPTTTASDENPLG